MRPASATINISNLRLRTLVGFNAEERVKKQDVVLNIEIAYALAPGILQDSVPDALDYKVLAKRVIAYVEDKQFLLLEKLVADVLSICSEHPRVERARVTCDKPHALRYADSVSVSLDYLANRSSNLHIVERAS